MTREDLIQKVQVLAKLPDEKAEQATDAVLETLCGRLDEGEVERLDRYIPELLGEACRHPRQDASENLFEIDQFIYNIRDKCDLDPDTAEAATVATFRALRAALPKEEVQEIAEHLPKRLRIVWLES